ncbi:hypothetical protein Tco_0308969 [Tanacetum coccineum]
MRREPRCNQESIITGVHRPTEHRYSKEGEDRRKVTGNPNQRGTGQTPTKMISLNLGRVRKKTLSHLGSGISISQGQGCLDDRIRDPKDHLKLFQSAAKTERWAMPTCGASMSSQTLTGNARENYLQQTKHIKDPVEIHHIKQKDGESTEDFMERYKAEVLDVEGAPECMKIFGFMHGITHPELISNGLYEKNKKKKIITNPEINGRDVQGDYVFSARGSRCVSHSLEKSTRVVEAT